MRRGFRGGGIVPLRAGSVRRFGEGVLPGGDVTFGYRKDSFPELKDAFPETKESFPELKDAFPEPKNAFLEPKDAFQKRSSPSKREGSRCRARRPGSRSAPTCPRSSPPVCARRGKTRSAPKPIPCSRRPKGEARMQRGVSNADRLRRALLKLGLDRQSCTTRRRSRCPSTSTRSPRLRDRPRRCRGQRAACDGPHRPRRLTNASALPGRDEQEPDACGGSLPNTSRNR